MMLGESYLTIENISMPEAASFDIDREVIESVYQTEAGTDVTIVKRFGKRKYSISWEGATSAFRDQIKSFCETGTVSVAFYNESFTARARDLKEKLVRYSNRYSGSSGLWDISFTLEEL